ncbi:MAG: hypothetical protein ABS939_04510 [Psychrobacillus sp.]
MLFKPYSDECTTFENVRVLKFGEESLEATIVREDEPVSFKNTKAVKIFYNTENAQILNTLQEVRLTSDKTKMKCRLDELISCSNIQETLKKWIISTTKSTI